MKKPWTPEDITAIGVSNAVAAIDQRDAYADPIGSYRQNVIDTMDELGGWPIHREYALLAYDDYIAQHWPATVVAIDESTPGTISQEDAKALLVMLEKFTFVAETVAHLRGLERELLPYCDVARATIDRIRTS